LSLSVESIPSCQCLFAWLCVRVGLRPLPFPVSAPLHSSDIPLTFLFHFASSISPLQHFQSTGTEQVSHIAVALKQRGFLVHCISQASADKQQQSLAESGAVVLFASEGAESQPSVHSDLRHAVSLELPIILMHEEGKYDLGSWSANAPNDLKGLPTMIEAVPYRRREYVVPSPPYIYRTIYLHLLECVHMECHTTRVLTVHGRCCCYIGAGRIAIRWLTSWWRLLTMRT
jgi:hypothetical protein